MIDIKRQAEGRIADSLDYVQGNLHLRTLATESDKVLTNVEDRGIQAGILKNSQEKIFDSALGKQFTTSSNYGPFIHELYPIITAWYPEFPLKELISVQDLDRPLGYIITSELLAATNKAGTVKGDKVETPSGQRTIRGQYPTGEVYGETLTSADLVTQGDNLVGTLYYYPIMTDKEGLENLKITTTPDATKPWTFASVANGLITYNGNTGESITIEVATGIITIKGVAATKVVVNYVWNIEYATNDNIPSVVEDMKLQTMEAKPRAIAMEWTVFSEYVKKKQFGIDIRTQTTKRVLDLLYQYLVRYILDKMYFNAEGTEATITVGGSGRLDVQVHRAIRALNDVSHDVQLATGRTEGNMLVVGNNFKSYLESLPDTFYKPFQSTSDYGFNGPRKIGSLGRYTIFYDNELPVDSGWMTYRGSQWYDAAYYLGVFLPIAPTDAVNINIKVKQAFIAMEAHRFDKPAAVIPLKFVNAKDSGD